MARGKNALLNKLSGTLGDFVVVPTGRGSVLRTLPARRKAQSELQSRQRALVGGLAQTWRMAGPVVQNGWLLIGREMADRDGKALNGFQAFLKVNTTLAALGEDFVMEAPGTVDAPPMLPPVLLLTAGGEGGSFRLTLDAPGYAGRVLVQGASPVLAGIEVFSDKAFKPLGVLDGLGAGTDLTGLYVGKFKTPLAGAKVAIRLVPVTETGFRGVERVVTGVVTEGVGTRAGQGDGLRRAA